MGFRASLTTFSDKGRHDIAVEQELDLRVVDRPLPDEEHVVDPPDKWSFFDSLIALSFWDRIITLAILFGGGLFLLVNPIIGLHDSVVAYGQEWIYPDCAPGQEKSCGAFAGAMLVELIAAMVVFGGALQMLSKILQLHFAKDLPAKFEPGVDYSVNRFFCAKSRVPLKDVTLRVVAYNISTELLKSFIPRAE